MKSSSSKKYEPQWNREMAIVNKLLRTSGNDLRLFFHMSICLMVGMVLKKIEPDGNCLFRVCHLVISGYMLLL